MLVWRAPLLAGLAVACAQVPADREDAVIPRDPGTLTTASADTGVGEPAVAMLSPLQQLTRVSLAVRGVRPSPEQLLSVRAEPERLHAYLDDWLESPEFAATMRDLHAEALLVRADTGHIFPSVADLAGYDQQQIFASMSEAPLVLVEDIVMSDRPYTEIVTADSMWADDIVATAWGLSYDPDGPTWQRSHWSDGRKHAGVLSDSALWLRHVSNGSNFNRGRANFIARTFLCSDFNDRDITVSGDIDVSDEFAVAEAVREDPNCVACHQALDPLAGFFWGYKRDMLPSAILRAYREDCREEYLGMATGKDYCYPLRLFNPEFEHDWELFDLRAPGYYGQSGQGVDELGAYIASDPRFAQCTARRFYAYLTQTRTPDVPLDEVVRLQAHFTESGFSARELVREIVTSPSFLADHAASEEHADQVVGPQLLRPEQYARTLAQLTGFEWRVVPDTSLCAQNGSDCWGEDNLMLSDAYGFRAMSGGIDSFLVNQPTHTMTPGKVLVFDKVAGEAAAFVVQSDLDSPVSQRLLLERVEADTVDESTIRVQLVELALRLHGRLYDVDHEEVDALWELFDTLHRSGVAPERAWTLILTAMLQEPAMVMY